MSELLAEYKEACLDLMFSDPSMLFVSRWEYTLDQGILE